MASTGAAAVAAIKPLDTSKDTKDAEAAKAAAGLLTPPTGHPVKPDAKSGPAALQTVCVFGGGTFGTALATVLARNQHHVTILMRGDDEVNSINATHKNLKYLKEYVLPDNIKASSDAKTALAGVTLIIHAIPVQSSLAFLQSVQPYIPADVPIVSLSKGIHNETLQFMCDIIDQAMKRKQPACFFSGPSFARELMDRQPTGVVMAAATEALANRVGSYFLSDRLRVYTSTDVVGVEVGGALKNIYAIAAGAAQGMGFGLNTAAFLVTRGCAEMKKLALARGAKESTLAGLSGIGDLMLTCFGPASRNRTVGVRLGKGERLDDILQSMGEVAEGVPTAAAAVKMAALYKVEVPIAQAIADVLAGKADLPSRVGLLLSLPLRPEDA